MGSPRITANVSGLHATHVKTCFSAKTECVYLMANQLCSRIEPFRATIVSVQEGMEELFQLQWCQLR